MCPKLIIAFEPLNEADFQAKVEKIMAQLTGNTGFPSPWPPTVTSMTELTASFEDYKTKSVAAQNRDTVKISERKAARAVLMGNLKRVAPYLEIVANGNVALLESSGYDLQHDRTHTTGPGVVPAPDSVRVRREGGSGMLVARAALVDGAASYEVQLASADPAVEANWKQIFISATPSRMEIKNLTPGTTYYVRVRGIGSRGPGAWAVSPGLIAV